MLTQLLMLPDLATVAGVAFGDLGVLPDEQEWLESSLDRFCIQLGRPAVTGFPIGHGPANHPVPEGVRAELDADRGILAVVEDPFDRTWTQ
jgi:muramoyltetrapeptide carboxypeptidase LdcA involved in peptidoglycan recycling